MRTCISAIATACLMASLACADAHAGGGSSGPPHFVPAVHPSDAVYDQKRDLLYVAAGNEVLRYSLQRHAFLSPIEIGTRLRGIDIAKDDSYVVVADGWRDATFTWVYVIDTETENVRTLTLTLDEGEAGMWDVVAIDRHTIMTTSNFEGSGIVPLRLIDLDTGNAEQIAFVTQWTKMAASAGRDVVAFAEGNTSGGYWGTYAVSQDALAWGQPTSTFNYDVAANPEGTQFVIPAYAGSGLYDAALAYIGPVGPMAALSAAYDPVDGTIYIAVGDTNVVEQYDPVTRGQLGSIRLPRRIPWHGGQVFDNGGLIRFSRNGRYLFATTPDGVAFVDFGVRSARATK